MSLFIAVEHPDVVRSIVIIDSITAAPLGPGVPPSEDPVLKCPSEPDIDHWKCRLSALSYKPDVAWDDEFWEAGKYMASLPKSREASSKVKGGAGESSGPTPANSPFNIWKKDLLARVEKDPNALRVPVLIIWGHDDHSVPVARGYALYDVIAAQNPQVRMVVVNRADHFDFRTYADEYNSYIINYIDRWERQPAGAASKTVSGN
jgi:pimeloyl-ACP methyl ester carboxylesterase